MNNTVMSDSLERKVSSVLLALETANIRKPTPQEIQHILDDPEVASWLTVCRKKGYGNANVFTTGR